MKIHEGKGKIAFNIVSIECENKPAPQGYKTFFMLILTEHKIYHAHKC